MLQRRLAATLLSFALCAAAVATAQDSDDDDDDCRNACDHARADDESACQAERHLCSSTLAPPDPWGVARGDVCAEAFSQCVRRAESDYEACVDECGAEQE